MSTTQKMDAFVAEELAQWAPLLEARMKEQVSRQLVSNLSNKFVDTLASHAAEGMVEGLR